MLTDPWEFLCNTFSSVPCLYILAFLIFFSQCLPLLPRETSLGFLSYGQVVSRANGGGHTASLEDRTSVLWNT